MYRRDKITPIENINVIMLYQNTKSNSTSDGVTDTSDISLGELQDNKLAPFLSMTCLDYVIQTPLDKYDNLGFILKRDLDLKHPLTQQTTELFRHETTWFSTTEATSAKEVVKRLSYSASTDIIAFMFSYSCVCRHSRFTSTLYFYIAFNMFFTSCHMM